MPNQISRAMLKEIIGIWELHADMDTSSNPGRRETFRECADTIRLLLTAGDPIPPQDCPHAAPFRYCPTCVVRPCPIGLGPRPDPIGGARDE